MQIRKMPEEFRDPPAMPESTDSLLELDVEMKTFLYGGGAVTGRNDLFDPFRVPSIRGQLRFWWRATRGGEYSDPAELRKAESRIWGATDHASPVKLRILGFRRPEEFSAAEPGATGKWRNQEPGYVLFPAQEDRKKIGRLCRGGGFRLEIRTPKDYVTDVDSALWAWFAFGGIGGRTRRGCGSLYCKTYAHTWKSESFLGDGNPRDWPILRGGELVLGSQKSTWHQSWLDAVALLQQFRQEREYTRGPSCWPEANVVRRMARDRSGNPPPDGPFPRAALGLPIIFHFKSQDDPQDCTLNAIQRKDGENLDLRLASPVIVKPWGISATEAVPMLLALNTKSLAGQLPALPGNARLVLRQKHESDRPAVAPGGDAIDQLVAWAQKQWGGQRYRL